MSDRQEQILMIADCINRESKLTDWERSFIDSLNSQVEKGYRLSVTQVHRLTEIWEKIT